MTYHCWVLAACHFTPKNVALCRVDMENGSEVNYKKMQHGFIRDTTSRDTKPRDPTPIVVSVLVLPGSSYRSPDRLHLSPLPSARPRSSTCHLLPPPRRTRLVVHSARATPALSPTLPSSRISPVPWAILFCGRRRRRGTWRAVVRGS